jgi:diguanylate cyclase (GGDEF)-like protein/PAS domain S-box-containing protein
MGFFWAVDLGGIYEPPHLMMALNLLFMLPVALFVAYQTGRGFLLRGQPGLLWFSCGILFWGGAGPLGGSLLAYGPEAAVTVHNVLIGLAAVCHFAGTAFAPWPRSALRWPQAWLAGAYAGVLTLMVVVVLATLSGAMPAFFIQGEGGTPLRQIVLGSAVALFVLTAILLLRNPGGTRSAFQYGYALALLLIAVGLFGVLIQSNVGSALGWTGRFAQYLGSLYLMIAAVVGMRENRDGSHLLEAALGEATRRLEELLSRYELVLAGAQDAIWDWDVVHQRVHFSPQWKALRGYTEDEVSDHESEWSAGIHPDDAPRVFARLQEHFTGQSPVFAEEYRIRCKDGSWKWIYDRGLAQRNAAGQVVRMAGSESDITVRKQTEEVICRNEQFKQAILDAMSAHVAVLDREGSIVAINAAWRRFAIENSGEDGQPTPHTGMGVNYREVCRTACGEGAEDALDVLKGIDAVLAGDAKCFSHEYTCHSPEKPRWFSLAVTPLGDGSGGVVIAHTDITLSRQLAEQLRNERDRLTRIAASVPGVICSFRRQPDGKANFPYASPAIDDLYGLSAETLAESAAPLWAMFHPDDLAHLDAGIDASAQTMTPWRDEFRVRHPSKGEIWVEGHSMPVREADGSLIWQGYLQDITERKRAEQQLFEAHERLNALMQALPVGVSFSDDPTCQHITGNPMLLAQFEMTPQDNVSASAAEPTAAGRRVRYFHQGQEIGDAELPLQRAAAEDRVIPAIELEIRLPSGRCWLAEVIGAPLHDAKNQTIGGLAVVMDISQRKRLEEDLRRLATTDPLTGAFNRRYLAQALETEISRAQRHARPLSLIMFDLDHFKRINDQFGHDQGDAVLKNIAMLVRDRLRHTDVFVRWGGEEFMILAPETAMPQALALAETLQAAFRQSPIGDIGPVTASFGVAEYRPDETMDQWLKRVDEQVYQVKRDGRDRISYRP